MRQRCRGVLFRCGGEHGAQRIGFRQGAGNAPEAGGAGEIETVEVDNLRVAAVGNHCRGEQGRRHFRQEAEEPPPEFLRRQHAAHEVRLHERRAEKVRAARLPRSGIVRVPLKPVAGALDDQLLQFHALRRARVVECEGQSEGRVRMHARADGIRLLRQELQIALLESRSERREVYRPCATIGIVPAVQFLRQLQQPRPAVGPLETPAPGFLQICRLGCQVLLCQVRPQGRADFLRLRQSGMLLQ